MPNLAADAVVHSTGPDAREMLSDYLAAEDDYDHMLMGNGAALWHIAHPVIGKYHLCKEDAATCQAK